jgi:hypothetical protein
MLKENVQDAKFNKTGIPISRVVRDPHSAEPCV